MILGTGTDALSRTSAKARITYRVGADGANAARLVIGMDYSVQGPLAQFSRSELVRSLVRQMLREFGRNLEAMASGKSVTPAPAAGLNAFALIWRWLLSLFGGSKGGGERRD